jgi:hypothetical protein
MTEEHAGIYWPEEPEDQFYRLPEESQARLTDFLDGQLEELQASGGGDQEGLSYEWEPGYAVYWDIKLRPKDGKAGRKAAWGTLGSHYRIEVLEIRKLPRTRR